MDDIQNTNQTPDSPTGTNHDHGAPAFKGAPQNDAPEREPSSGGLGPVAGIVIILIVLVLGGLYFWGSQLESEQGALESAQNEDIASEEDEPDQIESDLNEFDTAQFDAQIESELDAMESEL